MGWNESKCAVPESLVSVHAPILKDECQIPKIKRVQTSGATSL